MRAKRIDEITFDWDSTFWRVHDGHTLARFALWAPARRSRPETGRNGCGHSIAGYRAKCADIQFLEGDALVSTPFPGRRAACGDIQRRGRLCRLWSGAWAS